MPSYFSGNDSQWSFAACNSPPALLDQIKPIGNAAGEGAKMCAVNATYYETSKRLAAETEFLELASRSEFQDCFVDALEFCEEEEE